VDTDTKGEKRNAVLDDWFYVWGWLKYLLISFFFWQSE